MVLFRVFCLLLIVSVFELGVASEKYAEYNLEIVPKLLFDFTRNTLGYYTHLSNFAMDHMVTFHCRTPSRPEVVQVLPNDPELSSKLDTTKKLTLVVHGFIDNKNREWVKRMLRDLAQLTDVNACIVDWSKLSTNRYVIAVRHVNKIGEYVGDFLLSAQEHFPLNSVSLVGHSLGAHIAGAAGARTGGRIGAIFGLDPAHPLLTLPMKPENQRLDPSDAQFVQILHTTSGTLGTPSNLGHQDWYADNGMIPQKGCEPGLIVFDPNAFSPVSAFCSHARAFELFRMSLDRRNQFKALEGDDIYGFWSKRTPGVYHFATTRERPYV